jgi:hypothetical protein
MKIPLLRTSSHNGEEEMKGPPVDTIPGKKTADVVDLRGLWQ